MGEQPQYKIEKQWDFHLAEFIYILYRQNGDNWQLINNGDRAWAKRNAIYLNIELPPANDNDDIPF